MADHIRIRDAGGTWTVRAGGAILAETKAALELTEGDRAPVIYFPRADVAMAFFDRTDKVTHCPHKGDAAHFTLVTEGGLIDNAAWSYEAPFESVARIAGHLAFYARDGIEIEEI